MPAAREIKPQCSSQGKHDHQPARDNLYQTTGRHILRLNPCDFYPKRILRSTEDPEQYVIFDQLKANICQEVRIISPIIAITDTGNILVRPLD